MFVADRLAHSLLCHPVLLSSNGRDTAAESMFYECLSTQDCTDLAEGRIEALRVILVIPT